MASGTELHNDESPRSSDDGFPSSTPRRSIRTAVKVPLSHVQLTSVAAQPSAAQGDKDVDDFQSFPSPKNAKRDVVKCKDAARPKRAISTVSHISFAEDGSVPPKKPTSVAEVAKQRELSGTLQCAEDSKTKQISNAKSKELSGHGIFADPQDSRPNRARNYSSNGSSASHTPVKNANVGTFSFGETSTDSAPRTAKKITGKKFTDLTGNDIFKGDAAPASVEKHLSTLKLNEITGSNIFGDGKEPTRERVGGNRKPPGGVSSITLV